LSEVTDDVYAESVADADADLGDYNRLIQQTQKKLHIVDDDQRDQVSILSTGTAAAGEQSDEFIRNFFIKFGMRKTLEAF